MVESAGISCGLDRWAKFNYGVEICSGQRGSITFILPLSLFVLVLVLLLVAAVDCHEPDVVCRRLLKTKEDWAASKSKVCASQNSSGPHAPVQ
jgi:uncharacterized membrane protein